MSLKGFSLKKFMDKHFVTDRVTTKRLKDSDEIIDFESMYTVNWKTSRSLNLRYPAMICRMDNKSLTPIDKQNINKFMKTIWPRDYPEATLVKVSADINCCELGVKRNHNGLDEMVELIEAESEDANKNKKPLSVSTRLKLKRSMQRNRAKLKLGQRKWKKRLPDAERIAKRAKRRARSAVKAKVSKGNNSFAARANAEKVANRKNRIIALDTKKKKVQVRKDVRARARG